VHVQFPPEQSENMHVAPLSHCSVQPPLEHSTEQVEPEAHAVRQPPPEHATVHTPPVGQDVLHRPLEHSIVQAPEPQLVRHLPLEQSCVQSPDDAQVSAQFPPEQSLEQGDDVQAARQLPGEHEQLPLGQSIVLRAPAPGSGTTGPPFVFPPVIVPELPQPPVASREPKTRQQTSASGAMRRISFMREEHMSVLRVIRQARSDPPAGPTACAAPPRKPEAFPNPSNSVSYADRPRSRRRVQSSPPSPRRPR
jgi:hypothetical protein